MIFYIASPLGFNESGRIYMYERLIPAVKSAGHKILDPWKLTSDAVISQARDCEDPILRARRWREVNAVIGENNAKGIREADGIIALLDGSDVDSGTSSEIGYAFALGKVIYGVRTDFRLSGDNEGATVNLQVEYFIKASEGEIFPSLESMRDKLKTLSQL